MLRGKITALLFKRSMFTQDSRNKSENDGCWGRWFNTFGLFFKRIYHTGFSANELTLKAKNDNCVGRSMIEMLGVLAIIGVLSVGGIAGYSKAMLMYKMDKWKAQISDLVFSTKDAYKNEKKYGNPNENILPTLQQIGVVPQDMLDKNNRDIFGNNVSVKIEVSALNNGKNLYRFAFFFRTKPSNTAVQNCRELYGFSQADPDVHAVVNWADYFRVCGKNVEDEYKRRYPSFEYDLQQVAEKCKICEKQDCTLILLYRNE